MQSCTGKSYISIFSFFFFCHICRTTVCWGPEILHPWQRDVKTSPRYTRQSWILDSTLWFPGFRYWIPEFSLSEELVFRIPVVRGIPNWWAVSWFWIPKRDAGFQKQICPRLRNLDSLRWSEKEVCKSRYWKKNSPVVEQQIFFWLWLNMYRYIK